MPAPGSQISLSGISASIDLNGLTAGDYDLPLTFDTEQYPEVVFQPEMETLPITLTDYEEVA